MKVRWLVYRSLTAEQARILGISGRICATDPSHATNQPISVKAHESLQVKIPVEYTEAVVHHMMRSGARTATPRESWCTPLFRLPHHPHWCGRHLFRKHAQNPSHMVRSYRLAPPGRVDPTFPLEWLKAVVPINRVVKIAVSSFIGQPELCEVAAARKPLGKTVTRIAVTCQQEE